MKYIYPRFAKHDMGIFRLGGPGLGNCLFIYARALVIAYETGMQMIWPTWPSIKVGPWLRHEKDKRFYGDLFSSNQQYVVGLKKLKLLFFTPKAVISHINTPLPELKENGVFMYDAFVMKFDDLIPYRDIIRDSIIDMTKEENKKCLGHDFSHEINVHVRLGDFSKPNEKQQEQRMFNTQLPIDWYVKAIRDMKEVLGDKVSFNIFSDGSDEELKPILDLGGCKRMFWGNAISDILALSQSKVIIASGSSFSLWARFLGNSNCITFTNQLFGEVCTGENKFEYAYGFDDELPDMVKKILIKEYL